MCYLVVLVVKNWLNTFIGCSNTFGFVLNHSSWWVSLINAWTVLINTSNQQSDTIRSWHGFLFWRWISLTKVKRQIWNSLSQGFNSNRLKVSISVIKGLNSSMFNESSGISNDAWGGTANMRIDFEYFLDAFRYNKSWVKSSFDSKDNSIRYFEANCWWAELI